MLTWSSPSKMMYFSSAEADINAFPALPKRLNCSSLESKEKSTNKPVAPSHSIGTSKKKFTAPVEKKNEG